jgi:hypothetical protein
MIPCSMQHMSWKSVKHDIAASPVELLERVAGVGRW